MVSGLHIRFLGFFLGLFCLFRRNTHLDKHAGKLRLINGSIAVLVVLAKHLLNSIIVHVIIAAQHTIGFRQFRWRCFIVLHGQVPLQSPRHLGNEIFRRESTGTAHIARALSVPERVVHGGAERGTVIENLIPRRLPGRVRRVRVRVQDRRVLQCTNHGFHQSQWIEGGFFARQVIVPQIRNSPVGGFEFFDQASVIALADQVAGNETGRAVDLGNLVRD